MDFSGESLDELQDVFTDLGPVGSLKEVSKT